MTWTWHGKKGKEEGAKWGRRTRRGWWAGSFFLRTLVSCCFHVSSSLPNYLPNANVIAKKEMANARAKKGKARVAWWPTRSCSCAKVQIASSPPSKKQCR